jgi:hypothetical protein
MQNHTMRKHLIFILLGMCCMGLYAKNADYIAKINLLKEQLVQEYPPNGRLPQDFAENPKVKLLMQMVDSDFDLYLSCIDDWSTTEMSEEELEIRKATMASSEEFLRKALGERPRKEQDEFMAKVKAYGVKAGIESRKREILQSSLDLWAANRKEFLIQRNAIGLLLRHFPKDQDVIDVLVKSLPDKYPWFEGNISGDKGSLVQTPVIIVVHLSALKVPEALPFVRSLGEHPFYHYRRDSMACIKPYGVQESIPHMIRLLDDSVGLVRAEAFYNLLLLTGTCLEKNRDFWYDKKIDSLQRAEAIASWRQWWEKHGGGVDDLRFHIGVVDRFLTSTSKERPSAYATILMEHLSNDIYLPHFSYGYGSHSKSQDTRLSEFASFWSENKKSLEFDTTSQKLILRKDKNILQQENAQDKQ